MQRRHLLLTALAPLGLTATARAATDDAAAWRALTGRGSEGAVLLFRHATAPGGGDPPGFVLGDCATQRNLSDEGRAQATRTGQRLRERGVQVGAVWHSQWCRTRDTAELAFPGLGRPEPAFNSFFGEAARQVPQTAEAARRLAGWRGPGVLVVVTHQVNITALTGVWPQSGEGVVVHVDAAGAVKLLARLAAS